MEMNNNHTKNLTIIDIAKLAGVSITTVSRVLNNHENVSKKTRRKVLQVINSVDYTPNEIARGLVTRNSNAIGLLIPDIMNSYYSELVRSIERTISAKGFSLLLCITNTEKEKEEYYINDMINRRVSGLIILSTIIDSEPLRKKLLRTIEVVSVEADVPDADRIVIDNKGGTYEIVKYLLDNGHRKIAFVGYQFSLSGIHDRIEGYKKALTEYNVLIRPEYIIEGLPTQNPGYDSTVKLLKLNNPPTAIHCMNEYCARGVYIALMEQNIRIPQDISVTAFDGLEASNLMIPKLTTAAMPIADLGEAAAEQVMKNILEGRKNQNKGGAKKLIMFPVKLQIGSSVNRI